MNHIDKADTDSFQNCICGTPIVPKLITNLVGLILQDKHGHHLDQYLGVFINEKKYYPYPTMPHPCIIND